MAYQYKEYPRHLYRPDGARRVVQNDAERDQALREGWSLKAGVQPVVEPAPAVVVEDVKPRGRKLKGETVN